MNQIEVTAVTRSLERKSTILWLELIDIFCLGVLCAVLNFLFGQTTLKVPLVYLPTLLSFVTLVLMKRGKPDQYLLHLLRYHLRPKYYSCFGEAKPIFSRHSSQNKRKR